MYYFAYGSNMSSRRLRRRIEADIIGKAKLPRYKLSFHKLSRKDGTGKCDIVFTGNQDDFVCGVVYEIDSKDKKVLDRIEERGVGYRDVIVEVQLGDLIIEANSYMAIMTGKDLKPIDWYLEHVVRGAEESGIDREYIDIIRKTPTVQDADQERKKDEMSVHV